MHTSDLAFLCRAGFERDLCDELSAWFAAHGGAAEVASPQASVVRVRGAAGVPPLADLVYARDVLIVHAELPTLGVKDRVTPLAEALQPLRPFSSLTLLAPDSDDTRPLAPLLGALDARLQALTGAEGESAAVWMLSGTHALVGRTPAGGGAAFAGGIPRLKFPREAPSRSTLKLEEAFHVLLTPRERERLLRSGGNAVDLGAAPGGWTFQLVQRGLKVTAIDNGRIDQRLMDSGRVQHLREDGFRYRPAKTVDWLVCDMVEKPDRVAELVVRWFREGLCRAAIFNLKLPMKRRFEAWQRARESLAPLLRQGYALRARQLYHDREEITVAVVPTAAVAAAQPLQAARAELAPGTRSARPVPREDSASRGKERNPGSRAGSAPSGKAVRQAGRTTPAAPAQSPRGRPARPGKSASGPTAGRSQRPKSRPPRSR
ncbi:MAG: 23S rRNA (cytidine(2498)-2'-O)-methyltransferase RlmM [Rhodanobacteraceae bacterium]|nr:23S rRNA (cytidine(2498)-2'-O)-methyltransferase RlmM [Rhodanobacteraceae bacterium]